MLFCAVSSSLPCPPDLLSKHLFLTQHAFYKIGGGATGGAWNGVGAALSSDGVHFADLGQVIQKDPNAVWLGSGSVLKTASGEYVPHVSFDFA